MNVEQRIQNEPEQSNLQELELGEMLWVTTEGTRECCRKVLQNITFTMNNRNCTLIGVTLDAESIILLAENKYCEFPVSLLSEYTNYQMPAWLLAKADRQRSYEAAGIGGVVGTCVGGLGAMVRDALLRNDIPFDAPASQVAERWQDVGIGVVAGTTLGVIIGLLTKRMRHGSHQSS